MAILGHQEFLPLADAVAAHWALADAAVGGGGILVLEGVDRTGFLALRAALAAKRTECVHHANSVEGARTAMEGLREVIRDRMVQFNQVVRVWWGDGAVGAARPGSPEVKMALEKFLRPVRDALRLWDRLNAGAAPSGISLPLSLGPGGSFDRAALAGLMADLLAAREELEEGEIALKICRAERDGLEGRLWEVMVAYSRAVEGLLGPRSPEVQSLPRLSPLPGHTPERLAASAQWDGEKRAARILWPASAEERVSRYEVRWCPGRTYATKRERVALSLPVTEGGEPPTEWQAWTAAGLDSALGTASYKVYVVLDTGNERGSTKMVVRRGAGPAAAPG